MKWIPVNACCSSSFQCKHPPSVLASSRMGKKYSKSLLFELVPISSFIASWWPMEQVLDRKHMPSLNIILQVQLSSPLNNFSMSMWVAENCTKDQAEIRVSFVIDAIRKSTSHSLLLAQWQKESESSFCSCALTFSQLSSQTQRYSISHFHQWKFLINGSHTLSISQWLFWTTHTSIGDTFH